jgi:hypothetical protein
MEAVDASNELIAALIEAGKDNDDDDEFLNFVS